jgi:membrane associated rhomboid family serine protease
MLFHKPDPNYTDSEQARRNFRLAVKISLMFVAVLWIIHLSGWMLDLPLYQLGVRPRELSGLPGILFAPLIHGSFGHLISNSLPMLVLGSGMLYLYPHSAFKVFPLVYFGSGLAVWLFARPSYHIGASGLVYGLAAYILVAGILRRDTRAIAATLLVYFLYGTLVWGVFPNDSGMSWETHMAAGLIGVALAIYFRQLDIPPRKRYSWEDENEDQNEDEDFFDDYNNKQDNHAEDEDDDDQNDDDDKDFTERERRYP